MTDRRIFGKGTVPFGDVTKAEIFTIVQFFLAKSHTPEIDVPATQG